MNIGELSAKVLAVTGAVIDSGDKRKACGSPSRAEQESGFIILFKLSEPCIVSNDAGKFS